MVQAVLPDVADRQTGRARRHLPRPAEGRPGRERPARAQPRVERHEGGRSDGPARRRPAGGSESRAGSARETRQRRARCARSDVEDAGRRGGAAAERRLGAHAHPDRAGARGRSIRLERPRRQRAPGGAAFRRPVARCGRAAAGRRGVEIRPARRSACRRRGARADRRPAGRPRSARRRRLATRPDARALGHVRLDRNRRSVVNRRRTAGGLVAGETRRAHRARPDGRRGVETGFGRRSAGLVRSADEGDRLVDCRPSPGMGRRDGRVLPAAPDRSTSQPGGARRPAAEARPVRREPRDPGTARRNRRARGFTRRARDGVSRHGQDPREGAALRLDPPARERAGRRRCRRDASGDLGRARRPSVEGRGCRSARRAAPRRARHTRWRSAFASRRWPRCLAA